MDRLAAAILEGDSDMRSTEFAQFRRMMTARSLATNRCDFVLHHVRQAFGDDPDVAFRRAHGREMMFVSDQAILVFKKLDRRRRTRNAPTQLALKLFGQLPLPMMPDAAPRFVAGWQMDRLNAEVETLWLTHPNGKDNAWALPMSDEGQGTTMVRLTPPPSAAPHGGAKRSKVRTKEAIEREGTQGDERAQRANQD